MRISNPNKLPTVDYRSVKGLQGNLKDLSTENYLKLKSVLENRGFDIPLFLWKDGSALYLMDGHQRVRVMQTEDMNDDGNYKVPYVLIEAESREVAKSKLLEITSQYGTITYEGYDEFVADLPEADLLESVNFDALPLLGAEETVTTEDDVPAKSDAPAISELGDIYQLGPHRLMCGDATDPEDVKLLFNGDCSSFLFTSPPYGDMRDYGGNQNLSVDNLASFIEVFAEYCDFMAVNIGLQRKDGEIFTFWDTYIEQAKDAGLPLTAWNVWSKRGMGGSLANMTASFPIEHEWIFVFGGDKSRVNRTKKNKSAGLHTGISNRQKDGTTKRAAPKTVQAYGRMGSVTELVYATGEKDHPAVFPVQLPAEYIAACSKKGDIISDPFGGSGTTIMACEQLDRICYMMELDPGYVDVVRKRYALSIGAEDEWQKATPKKS